MAFFLEEESEAVKFMVLDNSRHQWLSIEGEVKKWVALNWAKWEEEQPEWFTDVMKAKVPVDFIPADGDARRSMKNYSKDLKIEKFMTKRPLIINENETASRALSIMNEKK